MDVFGVKSDDPSATLTVTGFGKFTAYFRALPPPVPAEYWASLFTIVVTALVGSLLIPAVVGWLRSKRQTSRLNSFHQKMAIMYHDSKLDENDINQLNTLNKNISDSYAAGKINNEQYVSLKNEVSIAYQKISKSRIKSITHSNIDAMNKIEIDLRDAYSDGKLSDVQFADLRNEISATYRDIFKTRIGSLAVANADGVNNIKNDMADAYSDGKITELHYNLLNQKILEVLNNK